LVKDEIVYTEPEPYLPFHKNVFLVKLNRCLNNCGYNIDGIGTGILPLASINFTSRRD
jgi:hypothetical protein